MASRIAPCCALAFDDVRLTRVIARIDDVRRGFLRRDRTTHVFQRAAPFVIPRVAPEDAASLRAVRLHALESDPLAFGGTYAR